MKKFDIRVLGGVLLGLFLSIFSSLAFGFTGLVGFAALSNIEVPLASPVVEYMEKTLKVSSLVPYVYEFTDFTEPFLAELKKATEEGGYTVEELWEGMGFSNKYISELPEADRPSKGSFKISYSIKETDLDSGEKENTNVNIKANMLTDIRTQDVQGDLTFKYDDPSYSNQEEFDVINDMKIEYGYIVGDEVLFGKVTIDEEHVEEYGDQEYLEYINKWLYYDASEVIAMYNERFGDQLNQREPTTFELTDEEYKLIEKVLTSDEIQPEIVDLPGKTFEDGRGRCYMMLWDEDKISDLSDYLEDEFGDSGYDGSELEDLKELYVSFCFDRVTMRLYEVAFGITTESGYSSDWKSTTKVEVSITMEGYGKYVDISVPEEAEDLGPIIDENIDWETFFDVLEANGFPGILFDPIGDYNDVDYDPDDWNYEEEVGDYIFKFEYDDEYNQTIYKCLGDECVLSDYDEYTEVRDAERGYGYDYDYDYDTNRYFEYYTTANYVYTLTYDMDTYELISGKKCPVGSDIGCTNITEDEVYDEIGYWD